jgi:two-component system chemotaxis response regulator CheB
MNGGSRFVMDTGLLRPDVIAVGASAGGVQAISGLLRALPGGLPASMLIALHRSAERASDLPNVLARRTSLHVKLAEHGDLLAHGVCYVSEPRNHLTLGPKDRLQLLADSFYRGHSIDALFTSVAQHAGRRAIGVVLSGMLKDGSLGLRAIKQAGGIALVQDPREAEAPGMPESAIAIAHPIDLIAGVERLAEEICRRVHKGGSSAAVVSAKWPKS